MTDVACFCGCLYSFDGGGAACPKCGEYATVAAGSGFKSTERSCPEQPAADMNGAGQNGQVAGEGAGAAPRPLAGTVAGVITRDPAPGRTAGASRSPQS